jgi:cbb3-type cytochrome oxidase cytochrome c subunit
MAATDKPYRNQYGLDVVFAVSSILMLVSIIWMFVQDYNREYKTEQRQFRDVEAAVAQRLALAQLPSAEEVTKAEQTVEQAREARKAQDEQYRSNQQEIERKLPKKEQAEVSFQTVKADLESRTSFYNIEVEKRGPDSHLAKRYKKEMDELEKRLAEVQKERDQYVQEIQALRRQNEKIEAPVTKAVSELKKINDKFDTQVMTAIKKEWGFGDRVRTWFILDAFASPIKIQQFTINDVPIDYNFKHVTRFDRCTTCHQGIDRPPYTKESLRQLTQTTDEQKDKLEKARALLTKRKETLKGLADAKNVPNPDQLDLDVISKDYLTESRVTEFCAHPRLELFVAANSKHPAEKFGCTSCHSGQGSATSFTLAAHTPNSHADKKRWTHDMGWEHQHMWDFPMLPMRFIESSCLKCHYEVTDLISSNNRIEAPKLLRGYGLIKEFGCFGCHEIQGRKSGRQVGPDLRLEPTPHLGELTPAEVARIEADLDNAPGNLRKVGPSLYRLSEKTNRDWTAKWIMAPRQFRPDTKMPHFYGLSNNRPDVLPAEQKPFPDAEVQAITHYLFQASEGYLKEVAARRKDGAEARQKDDGRVAALRNRVQITDEEKKELAELQARIRMRSVQELVDRAAGHKADAGRGRVLFAERGCLACHSHESTFKPQGSPGAKDYSPAIPGEALFGPNLSQVAEKLGKKKGDKESARVWLTQWIMDPHLHSPRSRMPVTHLEAGQAADIAEWLLSQPLQDLDDDWNKLEVKQPDLPIMRSLAEVYLVRVLSRQNIDQLWKDGSLPEDLRGDLPVEEKDLTAQQVTEDRLKSYLGKKAISRLGCYACHDIPGFDNAKPIGVGLMDWGKKDPERLAFEDIAHYVDQHSYIVDSLVDDKGKPHPPKEVNGKTKLPYEKFYADRLLHHGHRTREGYLDQKIKEPRSYDHNRIRAWDDLSRMPHFQFARLKKRAGESDAAFKARRQSEEQYEEAAAREAVATFVLGLVAEPVPTKSTNQPSGDRLAEVKGRQILDKYNCAGCHLIRPGYFEFQPSDDGRKLLEASLAVAKGGRDSDHVFPFHHNWAGKNPTPEKLTAHGVNARFLADEDSGQKWLVLRLSEALRFQSSDKEMHDLRAFDTVRFLPQDMVYPPREVLSSEEKLQAFQREQGPYGGTFSDLLVDYLTQKTPAFYKRSGDGESSEARVSGPPSLMSQGERAQPEWLYEFLLNPERVRRMTILRMPRFNMSADEARVLVNYFAAVDRITNPGIGLSYPHEAIPQKEEFTEPYWRQRTAEYVARLKQTKAKDKDGQERTLYEQRLEALRPIWKLAAKETEEKLSTVKTKADLAKARADEARREEEKAKEALKVATDEKTKKKEADIKTLQERLKVLEDRRKDEEKIEASWASELEQLTKQAEESTPKELEKAWQDRRAYVVDAFKLVANPQLCMQCHQVGNLAPSQRATEAQPATEGPPLELSFKRLRPGWTERWVAHPQRFLTYQSVMPMNFPADKVGKDAQYQDWFVGSSREQVSAVHDVLMAYPRVSALPAARYWALPQPDGTKSEKKKSGDGK